MQDAGNGIGFLYQGIAPNSILQLHFSLFLKKKLPNPRKVEKAFPQGQGPHPMPG